MEVKGILFVGHWKIALLKFSSSSLFLAELSSKEITFITADFIPCRILLKGKTLETCGRPVHHRGPDWNILTTIRRIAKSVLYSWSPDDTFLMTLVIPWFVLQHQHEVDICGPEWSISKTMEHIAMEFCAKCDRHQMINSSEFSEPLAFPLPSPLGQYFWFIVKCLNSYWMYCNKLLIYIELSCKINCNNIIRGKLQSLQ